MIFKWKLKKRKGVTTTIKGGKKFTEFVWKEIYGGFMEFYFKINKSLMLQIFIFSDNF